MSGFTLNELHDCWRTLKHDGKLACRARSPPVQDALRSWALPTCSETRMMSCC